MQRSERVFNPWVPWIVFTVVFHLIDNYTTVRKVYSSIPKFKFHRLQFAAWAWTTELLSVWKVKYFFTFHLSSVLLFLNSEIPKTTNTLI